ncbi:unnamed protein product [Paramecium sonneborni]|uniref:Uncharacterized protein n=1 Tax=Paramecium sonneborni TaxID=65129 RepID=A0A8S1RTT0_9CILI|nr:unnamed protein product [Paramecium sonneborni]
MQKFEELKIAITGAVILFQDLVKYLDQLRNSHCNNWNYLRNYKNQKELKCKYKTVHFLY